LRKGERYVVSFVSIHDVTKAESRLRKAKLWCDMVPVPREITSDCGMALMIMARDADQVVSITDGAKVRWDGLWARHGGGFKLVRSPQE